MIFRHTIINNFKSQNPLLLLVAILKKNLLLAQRQQDLSSGWQNVGPTVAKSADNATNSQCFSNVGPMLANCRLTANVGPTAECYLG